MGIRALATAPRLEPKASCASCGRPLSVIARGKCIYCGAIAPGTLSVVAPKSRLPPELLVLLEPRPRVRSERKKWLVRIVVFGASSSLIAWFVGVCMKQ